VEVQLNVFLSPVLKGERFSFILGERVHVITAQYAEWATDPVWKLWRRENVSVSG
jgi:hypothetical protein